MSQMGFEPTIPIFQGAKALHALDRAITVIGLTRQIHTGNQNVNLFLTNVYKTIACQVNKFTN
jgi:hypothetical protein